MQDSTVTKGKNKCELCSMNATHSGLDAKKITHDFCEHHSLKDLSTPKVNKVKESNLKRLTPIFYVFLFIFTFPLIRQINGVNGMLYMMDFMGILFL